MNPLARLGAAAGTALVLSLGLTAPAHAGRYVHNDARGDVYVEHCTYTETEPVEEPTTEEPPTEEPAEECTGGVDAAVREGDITRTAIRHTLRKVIIRNNYRELTRGDAFNIHLGSIRTNENLTRHVMVMFADGMTDVAIMRPNGDPVTCRVGKTLDFAANVIELRIPRGCLSRPRWVKVGLGHMRFAFEETETETGWTMSDSMWIDDALSPTMNENGPVWSPRIRRG